MSFICSSCNIAQPAGTKMKKITTEIRQVTYPPVRNKEGKIIKIPNGHETVKEFSLCPSCSMKKYEPVLVDSKIINE